MTPERAKKAAVVMRYINNTDRTPIGVKFLPLYETVGLSPEQENAFSEFDAIYSHAMRSPMKSAIDLQVRCQLIDTEQDLIDKAKKQLHAIKLYLGNGAFNIATALCETERLAPSTQALTASDIKTIDKVANKLILFFR
jgi:hypothetical protein